MAAKLERLLRAPKGWEREKDRGTGSIKGDETARSAGVAVQTCDLSESQPSRRFLQPKI